MKNDLLVNRHIGISEKDEAQMLHKIGVASLDELIDKTIPTNIRLKAPLALPEAMTEYEFGCHIAELAAQNKLYTTYIGMGWYNTITPAVIQRNVFENPVWYTSYTPYQTEVSQGRLEALMNFQTAVCDLTGMPLANCSLLDEATAAAEAVTMMYALRPREMQKSGANVVFVDESIFPQTLAVITTRAIPQGIEIRTGRYNEAELTPDTFACILQYPNGDGNIEDYRTFVENAHTAGCKVAVAADILSLALLTPPGEWGADIVTHSTTKYMDGHATCVGGAIVDSGNFDWDAHADKFPGLTQPDESYHGLTYTKAFGKMAYMTKATAQLMRDLGSIQSPENAFLLNLGLETLHLRVPRHCENAQKIAEWLEVNPKVKWVNYCGLKSNKYYELAQKYMPNGSCGVIAFGLEGTREEAIKFMDSLKLACIVTHVADARTCVLHPASHTHRQLTDEQLIEAGVAPDLIRLSVGIENVNDIIADLEQAMAQV
mgnify:CR=1 FL=1